MDLVLVPPALGWFPDLMSFCTGGIGSVGDGIVEDEKLLIDNAAQTTELFVNSQILLGNADTYAKMCGDGEPITGIACIVRRNNLDDFLRTLYDVQSLGFVTTICIPKGVEAFCNRNMLLHTIEEHNLEGRKDFHLLGSPDNPSDLFRSSHFGFVKSVSTCLPITAAIQGARFHPTVGFIKGVRCNDNGLFFSLGEGLQGRMVNLDQQTEQNQILTDTLWNISCMLNWCRGVINTW